jgi:hypothetical protein
MLPGTASGTAAGTAACPAALAFEAVTCPWGMGASGRSGPVPFPPPGLYKSSSDKSGMDESGLDGSGLDGSGLGGSGMGGSGMDGSGMARSVPAQDWSSRSWLGCWAEAIDWQSDRAHPPVSNHNPSPVARTAEDTRIARRGPRPERRRFLQSLIASRIVRSSNLLHGLVPAL